MDAPTVGVLRDVTLLVWLALLVGVVAYKWVRITRPAAAWNRSGRVDVSGFLGMDGLVVAAISVLVLGGLQSAAGGGDPPAPDTSATELNAKGMFLSIIVQLMICSALLFYLRALRNLDPVHIFGLRRHSVLRCLGSAALFMLPTFVVVMSTSAGIGEWLQSFWPDMTRQESVEAFQKSTDPLAKGMLIIAAVIVAPIVEETVFRGFIYGVLKRYTDGFLAALCTSLLFAVVHLHIGSLIPLAVLALLLCAAYELTGSLVVPMMMHGIFNASSIVIMILFPEAANANPG